MRRHRRREELIADVVAAWDKLPTHVKPDLMIDCPDLYFACAWLAAHENVRKR